MQELLERLGGQIDLLKLDVEGAERELFSQNPDWLNNVSAIFIELHDPFVPGCAQAFYSALTSRPFRQEQRGDTTFIDLSATVCKPFGILGGGCD
jgi:hypothetical protein